LSTRSDSRYPLVTLVLVLLGCLGLVYTGSSLLIQTILPSDRTLLTELDNTGVSVAALLLPESTGLEEDDQILRIGGRDLSEWVDHALHWESLPDWHVGDVVTYEVMRDGERLTVPVILRNLPLWRQLVSYFWTYALALISLAITGYILLARPKDPSAQLLFLAAVSLIFISATPFHTVILVTPGLFWLENAVEFLFESLLFSAIFHLFLIFPVIKPQLKGQERRLNALHLFNPIVSLAIGLIVGQTAIDRLSTALVARYWVGLAMLCGGIASILHTYRAVRQPMVRSQIRWIAWGSAVGLLPFLVLTGLAEVIFGRVIVDVEVTSFFIVALPASIAIAVARFRLFDIDTLIHQSLLYAFLMLFLSGVYLLLVMVIGPMVLGWLGGGANSAIVVFVSTVMVTTAFWALRSRVARVISRLFYRTPLPPDELLSEMSERLSNTLHLSDVAQVLTRTVPEQIGAHTGGLLVLDEEGQVLELAGEGELLLALNDVLAASSDERRQQPIVGSLAPEWFPPKALDLMRERGPELLVPLVIGEHVVGLWSLGSRLSGSSYNAAEVRALVTLGRQAAVSVQNARLIRRLEMQSQRLEEEVHLRTHDLETERNRLNVVLQNMVDGLLVTDSLGRVLFTNPAFDEMVRRPARTTLGRQLDTALAFPALSGLIDETLEKQLRINTVDLSLRDLVLRASASALRDGLTVVTVLRDITHEVEVDRMKTEFISTVSHELRTPLTSILGFTKLIRRSFDRAIAPALPEEKRVQQAVERLDQNLDIIVNEGERLTRLINDVLDIAKMEAGRIEWQDELIHIDSLVQKAVQSMSALAEEKGLTLNNQVQEDLPAVLADPDRVSQVLTNLFSNAIKFTEHGQIVVAARVLLPGSGVLSQKAPGLSAPAVMVSVTDSGIGIPMEDMPRLFMRFQQVGGSSLTNKPKGTGLGLAICREIVIHYGGSIWAESSPGQGSTFSFILPAAEAPEEEKIEALVEVDAELPLDDESLSLILIADDNPSIRELLTQTLQEEGYRTLTAIDGADLVASARRHRPALIISDVKMPGISGFDALHILKSDPATSDTPVIILSVVEERQQGLSLGAEAFLNKPIDASSLLKTISKLLSDLRTTPAEVALEEMDT
jgi:signal transduction histidine kinase/ActR/RegA family two-component response regulator